MDDALRVQEYLHGHIPISAAMGVTVKMTSRDKVVLHAPLSANINHRDTVFGGSAVSVAILSAWVLVHHRLMQENLNGRLVIRRQTMRYLQPIESDFLAECRLNSNSQWQTFKDMIMRKGMGRITLFARLKVADTVVGEFNGEYVFVKR